MLSLRSNDHSWTRVVVNVLLAMFLSCIHIQMAYDNILSKLWKYKHNSLQVMSFLVNVLNRVVVELNQYSWTVHLNKNVWLGFCGDLPHPDYKGMPIVGISQAKVLMLFPDLIPSGRVCPWHGSNILQLHGGLVHSRSVFYNHSLCIDFVLTPK